MDLKNDMKVWETRFFWVRCMKDGGWEPAQVTKYPRKVLIWKYLGIETDDGSCDPYEIGKELKPPAGGDEE